MRNQIFVSVRVLTINNFVKQLALCLISTFVLTTEFAFGQSRGCGGERCGYLPTQAYVIGDSRENTDFAAPAVRQGGSSRTGRLGSGGFEDSSDPIGSAVGEAMTAIGNAASTIGNTTANAIDNGFATAVDALTEDASQLLSAREITLLAWALDNPGPAATEIFEGIARNVEARIGSTATGNVEHSTQPPTQGGLGSGRWGGDQNSVASSSRSGGTSSIGSPLGANGIANNPSNVQLPGLGGQQATSGQSWGSQSNSERLGVPQIQIDIDAPDVEVIGGTIPRINNISPTSFTVLRPTVHGNFGSLSSYRARHPEHTGQSAHIPPTGTVSDGGCINRGCGEQ